MRFLKVLLILFVLLVIYRLISLNYENNTYLNEYYNKTNIFIEGKDAKRGRILDINGKVLVDNKPIRTIFYHRFNNTNELEIAKLIASNLTFNLNPSEDMLKKYYLLIHQKEIESKITKKELNMYKQRKISSEDFNRLKLSKITSDDINNMSLIQKNSSYIYHMMGKDYSYENKIILKDIDEETYAKIMESNIPGVFGDILWERFYPYDDTLRSILGSVGKITKEKKDYYLQKGYSLTDIVGTSYLELQYEDYLRGTKAKYKVLKNNTLKKIKEEIPGKDIVLNIDINLQKELDDILKESIISSKREKNTGFFKDSYVVISDPNTGAIKALSGMRYLKGNDFMDVTSNIITSSFTVGSVVKGATITVGYNNKIIDENTKVLDSCIKLYLVPEKCSYKRLGMVNDITALKESSNYFQFLIAVKLTNNKYSYNMRLNANKSHFDIYRNTLSDYGLGIKTGIDLPNEKEGIRGNVVADDLLLNLAIGQYDTYTPIMLSTYINTIASNGYVKKPVILNKVLENDNVVFKLDNNPLRRVTIEDKYLQRIRTGFNLVTTKGTARGYIPLEVSSGGKTGTSESFYDSNNDGKMDTKTISTSFVGFFPFDYPKYSIVIVSPNISNYKDNDIYISNINRHISNKISKYIINNSF